MIDLEEGPVLPQDTLESRKYFFGDDDGNIFHGTKTMESFSIIPDHITNTDVQSLFHSDDVLYIGSQDFSISKGISEYNLSSSSSIIFSFEETINMTPHHCIL